MGGTSCTEFVSQLIFQEGKHENGTELATHLVVPTSKGVKRSDLDVWNEGIFEPVSIPVIEETSDAA